MRALVHLCSACCLLIASSSAAAWEVDGLRSGMALAEATKVALARGVTLKNHVRTDRKDAYFVATSNGWLAFCRDVLYGYEKVHPGGFETFVMELEKEQSSRRVRPTLTGIAVKFELLAVWDDGDQRVTLGLSRNYSTKEFLFSKSYDDAVVERNCERSN